MAIMGNGKIIVPEIWIPKYKDVGVEAGIGVWGELEWQLIDKGNFLRPTVVRKGRQRNLIVNVGLNGSKGFILVGYMQRINLGTGTSEPLISDTALQQGLFATPKACKTYSDAKSVAENPSLAYVQSVFQIDEDECNGDLTEWGTFRNNNPYTMWCRELFRDENGNPIVVTKTNQQILVFTYNCYYKRSSDNPIETVFTINGTDYTFATLINNEQLLNTGSLSGATTEAGTSNAASSIDDSRFNVKGTRLGLNLETTAIDYVQDSYTTEYKITVDTNQWNGNIGEIVWNYKSFPYARTTITPVFPKTSSQKLYITFKRTTVRV